MLNEKIGNEKQSLAYMSSNLTEYNRMYKEFNQIYHEMAQKMGISNSVFDILYSICELGDGCRQKDICDANFIPKQTVNSAIRVLEKQGVLNLAPGKGREMNILLTETGRKQLEQVIYPIVEMENNAFSILGEEEAKQLLMLQQKYMEALREQFQALDVGGNET
ncbi:MAG: MarR family transcriptional regulator [Eubacterium sp.]|nr:MarR family transcriptional regulator [Eubacterium sp.]